MKKTCEVCGITFNSDRNTRRFCSNQCSHIGRRKVVWNKGAKGTPSRKKTGEKRNCKKCGNEFYASRSSIEKDNGIYCSQSCYLSDRWKQDGLCINCGKECETRFCNQECQKSYWNNNGYKSYKKNRNWERKLEIIDALGGKCVKCGFDDYRALDINHINPDRKVRPKDGCYNWTRRFKDWSENMDNIELLCANCHRLHTWEQRNFGSTELDNQCCNH